MEAPKETSPFYQPDSTLSSTELPPLFPPPRDDLPISELLPLLERLCSAVERLPSRKDWEDIFAVFAARIGGGT